MIRRDFIKYFLGTLSTFCLTGNFSLEKDEEYYYDDEICLGKYKSHTIQYDLDMPKNFYLGESIYCRYVTFPKEYTLKICYSNFDVILLCYNIKLEDIPLIISKKTKRFSVKK